MMSKHFKKHISDLGNRQFRRRIKSETEKVLKYVFENIKDNSNDTDKETREGNFYNILNFILYNIILKNYVYYETIYFIL